MYVNFFLKFQYLYENLFDFNQLFFSFSNYCYVTYVFTFLVEFLLCLYIMYSFLFFFESRINFKPFFFRYIFFLCFLLLILIGGFFFNSSSIICFHLVDNLYIAYSKFLIILLLIIILLLSTHKFLLNPHKLALNEIPSVFSFLLLFICILFSSFDFFVMYIAIEGISLILYSLGSLMNLSMVNVEAIIKYFLINNMASSLLL